MVKRIATGADGGTALQISFGRTYAGGRNSITPALQRGEAVGAPPPPPRPEDSDGQPTINPLSLTSTANPIVKPSTPLLVAPRLSAQGSMRGLVNPMAMPRADRIALANRSLQAEAEAEATAAEEEGKTIPAKFGQFNTFKRPGGRPVGSIVEEGKEEEEDGSDSDTGPSSKSKVAIPAPPPRGGVPPPPSPAAGKGAKPVSRAGAEPAMVSRGTRRTFAPVAAPESGPAPPPPPPGAGGRPRPSMPPPSLGNDPLANPIFSHRVVEKRTFVAKAAAPRDPVAVVVADSTHMGSPMLAPPPMPAMGGGIGMSSAARVRLLGPSQRRASTAADLTTIAGFSAAAAANGGATPGGTLPGSVGPGPASTARASSTHPATPQAAGPASRSPLGAPGVPSPVATGSSAATGGGASRRASVSVRVGSPASPTVSVTLASPAPSASKSPEAGRARAVSAAVAPSSAGRGGAGGSPSVAVAGVNPIGGQRRTTIRFATPE